MSRRIRRFFGGHRKAVHKTQEIHRREGRFDIPGAITATLGMSVLVFALIRSASGFAAAAFAAIAILPRVARTPRDPVASADAPSGAHEADEVS